MIQADTYHVPVLADEVITGLNIDQNGTYLDGTMGGGGHSSLILKQLTNGKLFALDQDPDAIEECTKKFIGVSNIEILHGNFRNASQLLSGRTNGIDGALLDLGVSSHQFDESERGFSYNHDGNLDMRMSQEGLSAEDVVNTYDIKDLTRILREYGEEKYAYEIARKICREREISPITTTAQLADVVISALPAQVRRKHKNPAKQTFQAIRIEVNDELGALRRGLEDIFSIMNPKGRFCIITFHSLEDRIVKQYFRSLCEGDKNSAEYIIRGGVVGAKAVSITKKPIVATEEELANNRRSHSAKLRIIEKI